MFSQALCARSTNKYTGTVVLKPQSCPEARSIGLSDQVSLHVTPSFVCSESQYFLTGASSPYHSCTVINPIDILQSLLSAGALSETTRLKDQVFCPLGFYPWLWTAAMPRANVRKTRGVSRSVNSLQPSKSRFLRNKQPAIHNMSALALERGLSKSDFHKQFSSKHHCARSRYLFHLLIRVNRT